MRSAKTLVNSWPLPIAAMMSGAMLVSTVMDKVDMPDWLTDAFTAPPQTPDAQPPKPDLGTDVPYAPAPGRDDRTPIPFLSHVFGLDDGGLPEKLTGIGPVFWDHAGHGTGALIAPDIVLTTAHLFTERGKWDGPYGPTDKPPAPSDGRIYLAACGQAYDLKAIHLGSLAPRARLGVDYAIAELATPACKEATVLPVALTPDDLTDAEDQILLNMGAYYFADLDRYARHPLFADRDVGTNKFERFAVFGVRCRATGREDTGDVPDGSTAVIITEGCDGVPGGSGGPLLVSRDGGATYSIIGVANSYRPDTEYNNYTRIEGAFAKHLAQFVDLLELPAASAVAATRPSHITTDDPLGPWDEMRHPAEEDQQ